MRLIVLFLLSNVAAAEVVSFGSGDSSFEMEFLEVGDLGNPGLPTGNNQSKETASVNSPDGIIEVGSVDYFYQIAKYEVSLGMFETAIASGATGLTADVDEMQRVFGFVTPNLPAMNVSYREALSFANWLNEYEGYPPAYKFMEEEGRQVLRSWEFGDVGFDPKNPMRNSLAKFAIPTGHEWEKAAYWNPSEGKYNEYSTGNDKPESVLGSTDPGTAVYGLDFRDGPAEVFEAGGPSSFGVVGMDGNVGEWEEGDYSINGGGAGFRSVRGGSWSTPLFGISSDIHRLTAEGGGVEFLSQGLRIAMVEPNEVVVGDFNDDGAISQADLNVFEAALTEDREAKAGFIFGTDSFVWNPDFDVLDLDDNDYLTDADRDLWLTLDQSTPGDSDLDGDVDFQDFLSLANSFGVSPSSWAQGDFDGNNETNFLDFLALANNFGNASQIAAVPEPSSSLLALLLVVPALPNRKRRTA